MTLRIPARPGSGDRRVDAGTGSSRRPVYANRLRPKADFGGQEALPGLWRWARRSFSEGGTPGPTGPCRCYALGHSVAQCVRLWLWAPAFAGRRRDYTPAIITYLISTYSSMP